MKKYHALSVLAVVLGLSAPVVAGSLSAYADVDVGGPDIVIDDGASVIGDGPDIVIDDGASVIGGGPDIVIDDGANVITDGPDVVIDDAPAVVYPTYGDDGLHIYPTMGDDGLHIYPTMGDDGIHVYPTMGDDGIHMYPTYGDDGITPSAEAPSFAAEPAPAAHSVDATEATISNVSRDGVDDDVLIRTQN